MGVWEFLGGTTPALSITHHSHQTTTYPFIDLVQL